MNLRQKALQELINSGIEPQEAAVEVDILIEAVYGFTKKHIIMNKEIPYNKEFEILINRRLNEKIPVQYLINRAYFMGEEFYVDENVLIPRPETEILVEVVGANLCVRPCDRSRHAGLPLQKIIDIGTGSGCIAVMLAKKLPDAEITASDISENALKIAKLNAEKLNVSGKIKFVRSNIFENIDKKFDIIVSNPPYISIKDKESLQIEVQKHEPPLALFVDDEQGISFYEKLSQQAAVHLNKQGFLAVEIGFSQAQTVEKIFKINGFKNIKIVKDMSGIERVIIARIY